MCLSIFWKLLRSIKQNTFGKKEIPPNPPAVPSGSYRIIILLARKQNKNLLQATWQDSCLNTFQLLLVWATTCWKSTFVKIQKVATNLIECSWCSSGDGERWTNPVSPQHLRLSCVLPSGCPYCSESEVSTGGANSVAVVQNAPVLEPSDFATRASATSC